MNHNNKSNWVMFDNIIFTIDWSHPDQPAVTNGETTLAHVKGYFKTEHLAVHAPCLATKSQPLAEVRHPHPTDFLKGGKVERFAPSYVTVRSLINSETGEWNTGFEFDGSLIKHLQGHNVWGSDNLEQIVKDTFFSVLNSINPELIKLHDWDTQKQTIKFSRIDINASYDLGSFDNVFNWLQDAYKASSLKNRGRACFPNPKKAQEPTKEELTTLYWGTLNGKTKQADWYLKAYHKHTQIVETEPLIWVHDYNEKIFNEPRLPTPPDAQAYAEKALRVEITLKTKELKRKKLHALTDWQGVNVYDLFKHYTSRLSFDLSQMDKSIPNYDKLPTATKAVFMDWFNTKHLEKLYRHSTLERHRKIIRDITGHDILKQQCNPVDHVDFYDIHGNEPMGNPNTPDHKSVVEAKGARVIAAFMEKSNATSKSFKKKPTQKKKFTAQKVDQTTTRADIG
ncbi:phage/plasmid replication protein, II/X family [Thiothrix subterranea]|uniref:Phage/plasmid replication protein, II/X family n=1 Tax=Thiothrix subterranea TaxID=2735563 RepID=A0AA51MLH7_9GAMM|nr:phage/plasmid replication protein, II/X family [Thiothrix subterranea]MDQ5770987.1 phage/plasmid replication protein, II/X family [Thiothrix subterranea]WML85077.1 phage/plasmid replication protein, II/X family [Thiothrix subterranea]WML85081.1 phage/plasmid replication protein, II/X family [Thiothrix subterranea]WML85866.1 phage/plasmid replication protein, II/X family [Thiothrix subterranea]WML85870.1 phage/plasmid replication protein, II/X family [Thiothrix subterranea]